MFHLINTPDDVGSSPWLFGILGLFALTAGIVLVSRPKKSGEVWRKISQATSPWRVPKWPIALTVAIGCLCLLIAAAMLYGTWTILQE